MPTDLPPWVDIDDIAARRAQPRPWRHLAACRGIPWPDADTTFFPTNNGRRGGTRVADQEQRALADWCAHCTVAADCVADHLGEEAGVFGSTPGQRIVIRRRLADAGHDVRWTAERIDPRAGIPRSSDAERQARARATR